MCLPVTGVGALPATCLSGQLLHVLQQHLRGTDNLCRESPPWQILRRFLHVLVDPGFILKSDFKSCREQGLERDLSFFPDPPHLRESTVFLENTWSIIIIQVNTLPLPCKSACFPCCPENSLFSFKAEESSAFNIRSSTSSTLVFLFAVSSLMSSNCSLFSCRNSLSSRRIRSNLAVSTCFSGASSSCLLAGEATRVSPVSSPRISGSCGCFQIFGLVAIVSPSQVENLQFFGSLKILMSGTVGSTFLCRYHVVVSPGSPNSWLFYEINWRDMSRGRTIKGSQWNFSS